MKQIKFFVAALASLFLAGSCQQQENLEPAAEGTSVSFDVEVPGDMETKAVADGKNVDVLYYAIYKDGDGKESHENGVLNPNSTPLASGYIKRTDLKKFNITFDLLVDQEYVAIFWAQVGVDKKYYAWPENDDLRVIKYADSKGVIGNMEERAAFFRTYQFSTYQVADHDVTLYRPFAQLNLGSTLESLEPTQGGEETEYYVIDVLTSEVKVTGLAKSFNTIAGLGVDEYCGQAEAPSTDTYIFKMHEVITPGSIADVKEGEKDTREYLLVKNKEGKDIPYEYIAMNYFFANGNVTVEYDIVTDKGTVNNTVENVPVMENFRTNIIGNLLTSKTDFEIIVDERFDNEGEDRDHQYDIILWDGESAEMPVWNPEANDGKGQYEIYTPAQLAGFAAMVNNGGLQQSAVTNYKTSKYVLMDNINLDGQQWTPINGFQGTFEGNGKIIMNLNVQTEGKEYAALFAYCKNATIKDLTVENATITGHYKAAVIVGEGNCTNISHCHVKNAVVTSTPYNNDDANHVGGIVGHYVGESGKNTYTLADCTVENATISGYRDVAAIAGSALEQVVVTTNKVENVTVVADQTNQYKESKAPNAGAIAGRTDAKAKVESNTIGKNVEVYVLVNNAADLQNALNCAKAGTTDIRLAADIEGNVTVDQQEDKNIVINGNGKKYDGTITVDGNSRFDGEETLLIQNVNFETSRNNVYFVEMNSTDGALRYAHNVTIDNCTFTGNETTVGARFRQCYNIKFSNCEVISGHSLAQLYGCAGVTIEGTTVNAGRGVSLGTSTDVTVKSSTFEVASYGLRADNTTATLNIVDANITAKLPVVVRNLTSGHYTVNFTGENTLTGEDYQVVFTNGDDEDAFVRPEGEFTINGGDDFIVFPGVTIVKTAKELQTALNNTIEGENKIFFGANISGNVTVDQQEGKNVVINGREFNYDGTITVDGNSRFDGEETLLIQNVNFQTSSNGVYFVEMNSTDGALRYAHNVTIDNCTFTGNETSVGARFRQCYNIKFSNCEVISGHSLAQLYGCAGVTIEGTTVNAGRGVSLGTSTDVTVKNSTFEVASYGLRADNTTATLNIVDANITAKLPVVVRNLTSGHYTVNFTGANTLAGEDYQVVFTNGDDEAEFVTPTGTFEITGADGFKVFPSVAFVSTAAEFEAALEKGANEITFEENARVVKEDGSSFEVTNNLILNMRGNELKAGSIDLSHKPRYYAIANTGKIEVTIQDAYLTGSGISAGGGAKVEFQSGKIYNNPGSGVTGRYIFASSGEGTTITITDGEFRNNTAKNKYLYAADNSIIYVKGGNFTGTASNDKIITATGGQVIITGGTFNFNPTKWVADGYEAVKSGSNWTVQAE